jgi:hypothetical protein
MVTLNLNLTIHPTKNNLVIKNRPVLLISKLFPFDLVLFWKFQNIIIHTVYYSYTY